MITKTEINVIQAMVCLARQPNGANIGADAIAREIGARANYLGKILQSLSKQRKFIKSRKGKDGGFQLIKDPRKITLKDVIEALEGKALFNICFSDGGRCSNSKPCNYHHQWTRVRRSLITFFSDTTIADLAKMVDRRRTK